VRVGAVPLGHLTEAGQVNNADPPLVNSKINTTAVGEEKGLVKVHVVVPVTVADIKFPKDKSIVLLPEPDPN